MLELVVQTILPNMSKIFGLVEKSIIRKLDGYPDPPQCNVYRRVRHREREAK